MTLNDYIQHLTDLKNEVGGEIEVTQFDGRGSAVNAHIPTIQFMAIKKPRESLNHYWWVGRGEDNKGKKVIRL